MQLTPLDWFQMYDEIPEALKAGASDDNVVVTVITGAGSFYCSGNDLEGYLSWGGSDTHKVIQEAAKNLQ